MIRVRDRLAGTLVPMTVVVHAAARSAAPDGWLVEEFDGAGDITRLVEGGIRALQEPPVLPVTWEWIERLARAIDDVYWIMLRGRDAEGLPFTIECVDSGFWELDGSPTVEASVAGSFRRVEVVAPDEEHPSA